MFCLVLFIYLVILKADAIDSGHAPRRVATDDQYTIQKGAVKKLVQKYEEISGSGDCKTKIDEISLKNYDTNENFTAWKDRPLKIIIQNVQLQYIWCNNKYVKSGAPASEPFIPETNFANDKVYILNVTKVTGEMSTRWVCTVLEKYHGGYPYHHKGRNYTAKDLHFNLYVKGAKQVILTANNQNVEYDVKIDPSVEYYGVANYTYKDGEDVGLSCRKAQEETHSTDYLRLEYFNAKGISIFKSEPGKELLKFRSVLNFTNDKYYLDCICASTDPIREYRYRTTFYFKEDAEPHYTHAIKLYINGSMLTTISNNDTSADSYIFRYVDGEVLNITCQEIHSFPKGNLYFDFDRNLFGKEDPRDLKNGIIRLRLLAYNVHNKNVTCGIKNTEVSKPIARLNFLSDIPDNGINVRGLPRSNVLYQYTNGLDQLTIGYQYSEDDTLSLTCVAKNVSSGNRPGTRQSPRFQWKVGNAATDSPADWMDSLSTIKTSGTSITNLSASQNTSKIICTYSLQGKYKGTYNKTVQIILQLKSNESEIVNEAQTVPEIQMIVPLAVAFGVAVAIITILCFISWHKRTKRANLIENAYDNLSNQNDSPIPAFPSQWESNYNDSQYASIDGEVMQENCNYSTDEDSLNKMPYERASNISENHYTEIDDYFKPKPDGLKANWNSAQPSNNKTTSALKGTASHNSNNAIYKHSTGSYDKLMPNKVPINKDNENYSNVQSKGQPSNKKNTSALKETASHNSNNAIHDNSTGGYDKLMPSKVPINKDNENYSNGQNKCVTFRQMLNDSRTASKYNEGNSRQDHRKNDQRLKPNNYDQYANIDHDIYMQPGVMQEKPCYENKILKNKESVNSADLDYAEPYDFGISSKNNLTDK